MTAALEDDEEIERRPRAVPQEDDTIERRPIARRMAAADQQEPLTMADGGEAPPAVAPRASDQAAARAPAERRQAALVADGSGRDEGAQVAASEVVKAPQTPQAVAPRAPDQAVARAPAERRQAATVGDGLGRDEGAQVAASEVVKAPQVRGIAAGTGRWLETAVEAVTAAAGPATTEEAGAERTVVAALEPGAPARHATPSGAEGVVPTFDVVRISATGNAVIAGRAEPGAEVVVLDRGTALGQVKANRHGEWVLVPLKPLPPGATELYVEASFPGASPRRSEVVLVLSVPQRSLSQTARVGPLAMLTPRGGGATRVLKRSKRSVARDKGGPGVSLDVVDYDDAGNIILSGRADANAEVRVYTDNRLVGTVRSDKKGDWQLRPDVPITPGDHELRVDRVSVDGKVLARAVLPFSRADLQGFELRDGRVVVQPGNSLWRIARATYGSGFQYTLIYDANRAQIDDPDLIFPGQVFKVPEPN